MPVDVFADTTDCFPMLIEASYCSDGDFLQIAASLTKMPHLPKIHTTMKRTQCSHALSQPLEAELS